MSRSKRTLFIGFMVFSILGIIAYLAADRYLIRHVEIANASVYAGITSEPPPTQIATSTAETNIPDTSTVEASQDETITVDDWNYISETISIKIKKVTTGSGKNTLTYFVADVVLTDATQLQSAFADDEFGRNIIEYTSQIAQANGAIFAINGDYYGFRSDGIEIRNGVIFQDMPARIGVAFYRDGSMKIYDETQTSAEELLASGVWNTMSFGPSLVEDSVVTADLSRFAVDKNFGNRPIQGDNPRTGVGIIDNNHFVFVVADGRSPGYSRGANMTEFAQIFKDLGCIDAYNLDGGGSTTMYFMDRVVNNPLGKGRERGTSDILFIGLG